ncbi:phosphodiester glycosidase family protein [Paenibacillus xanthanilyticus]|uniref:Phosphodiester glycosidase family protein n=1 Tax=Paenibacillus xanthanilyticus TaxID=1783531 RepID=A0ABV8K5B1_9BACL
MKKHNPWRSGLLILGASALLAGGGVTGTGASASIASADTAAIETRLSYPSATVTTAANSRVPLEDRLIAPASAVIAYASGNPSIAKVNEKGVLLPVSVGRTTVTVKAFTDASVATLSLPVVITAAKPLAVKPSYAVRSVKAGGRTFSVRTVTVPKGTPVTAGLASRQVGRAQSLTAIAAAYRADTAINGTFFEAYNGVPDPYGNVISNGIPAHIGNTGTTIGFRWDGTAVMDTLRLGIAGSVANEKGPKSWYAYFLNRTPVSDTTATLFTPARGSRIGFAAETAVVVQNGTVARIARGENVAIPSGGFVLVFEGNESGQAARFQVGAKVDYTFTYRSDAGKELDWSDVHTAIGAGPRLVKNGQVAVNPAAEGFKDPKILTGGGARSGIAVLKNGSVMLATVPGATMKQWALIMQQLGAVQAMNLDGGASSGLLSGGKTVTTPGRALSNALLFGSNLKW